MFVRFNIIAQICKQRIAYHVVTKQPKVHQADSSRIVKAIGSLNTDESACQASVTILHRILGRTPPTIWCNVLCLRSGIQFTGDFVNCLVGVQSARPFVQPVTPLLPRTRVEFRG